MYSASHNILPNSASHILPYSAIFCYILPNSASHILLSSAVDTSRFKRVEDGEYISVYRRILAGLNSFSKIIIVIIQAIRRKKGGHLYIDFINLVFVTYKGYRGKGDILVFKVYY